ncbi:MAG: 4-(cytidine 5'-diphospho)-2-C-methyl-D-erythritol kinase [Vicingaceae bacterium]
MQLQPNAKINLGLFIKCKREDGFHELESVFVPVDWKDELEIKEAAEFSFSSSGLSIPGDLDNNLCVKAYQLLKQDFDIPAVQLHLHKNIPMGAGLGGGSSDAAFTLKGIDQLFELNLSHEKLEHYAAQLGSDCVFFIQNKTALVRGRGELLDFSLQLTLKAYVLMVKPKVFISTQEAYSKIKPQAPQNSLPDLLQLPIAEWEGRLKNDFEAALFPDYPELATIKEKLYEAGAKYAAMSGSGSCLYGLFDEEPQIPSEFEKYHCKVCRLD